MKTNEFFEPSKITDYIKFHDELNPKLWSDDKLLPKVRQILLKNAKEFIQFLELEDFKFKDIILTGSNAAFNYTSLSDLDIHIIVDFEKTICPDLADNFFNTKRYLWNENHEPVKVRGYHVELYVEDSKHPVNANGVYSLMKNDWVKKPKQEKPKINDIGIINKTNDYADKIEKLLDSNPDEEQISNLLAKLKTMRQAGLADGGEFSVENLTYKSLRNLGLLDKLWDFRDSVENKELSLESIEESFQYKPIFTFGDPEIYDSLLRKNKLVKSGKKENYVGGTVFPSIDKAIAYRKTNKKYNDYAIYQLDRNVSWSSDTVYQLDGQYHILHATKIERKVLPSNTEQISKELSLESLEESFYDDRLDRAKQLGFTIPAFHGTGADITAFASKDLTQEGSHFLDIGIHFSLTPDNANDYAHVSQFPKGTAKGLSSGMQQGNPIVYPVLLAPGNMLDITKGGITTGPIFNDIVAKFSQIFLPRTVIKYSHMLRYDVLSALSILQKNIGKRALQRLFTRHGIDSIKYNWGGENIVVFDPARIRSRFAQFDPNKQKSAGLTEEIITELFNSSVPFKEVKHYIYDTTYTFSINDSEFFLYFEIINKYTDLSFKISRYDSKDGLYRSEYDTQNNFKANPILVYGTIIKIIQKYINDNNPSKIRFSAYDERQEQVYEKLTSFLKNRLPNHYILNKNISPDGIYWEISKEDTLEESFDSSVPFNWDTTSARSALDSNYHRAEFTINSYNYQVRFSNVKDDVTTVVIMIKNGVKRKFDTQNSHKINPLTLYGTFIKIINEFLIKKAPNILYFSAYDERQEKFYNKAVNYLKSSLPETYTLEQLSNDEWQIKKLISN